jgi:hypothetical protein
VEKADTARLTASAGRRFAWTLAVGFAVLAVLAEWRGRGRAAMVLAVLAGLLFIGGATVPTRLGPIERAWMGLAGVISRVTTPIFMGIVYFVVLTPIGFLRRTLGKRTLSPSRSATSFWVGRKQSDPETARRRMERQF